LGTYVLLTYVLSWAYWIPLALGTRTVESRVGWPTQMPGLLGPAVSAVVVTALVGGRAGVVDLRRRLTRWRVGWWWLSVVAVLVAGAVGLAAVGGPTDTADLTRYNGISAGIGPIATISVVFVLNGIGEETGWRGFLADRLLHRHSLTVTALLVALAWAPWHAPLFFFQTSFMNFTPARLAGWVIGLTAGSVVLAWLYRGGTGSILLVAIWHTAFNFTSATPAAEGTVAAITSTVVMVVAVGIVAADWRRHRAAARDAEVGTDAEVRT
jgi:membrane protease YdiL (CAAX protease family)